MSVKPDPSSGRKLDFAQRFLRLEEQVRRMRTHRPSYPVAHHWMVPGAVTPDTLPAMIVPFERGELKTAIARCDDNGEVSGVFHIKDEHGTGTWAEIPSATWSTNDDGSPNVGAFTAMVGEHDLIQPEITDIVDSPTNLSLALITWYGTQAGG